MRTGPNLTEMNNRMIIWEFARALRIGDIDLAVRITHANPHIPFEDLVLSGGLE